MGAPARAGRGAEVKSPVPRPSCQDKGTVSQHLVSSKGCQGAGPAPPARAPTRTLCWKEMIAKDLAAMRRIAVTVATTLRCDCPLW